MQCLTPYQTHITHYMQIMQIMQIMQVTSMQMNLFHQFIDNVR